MSRDAVSIVRELFELQHAGRFDELAARYRDDAVIRVASDSGVVLRGGDQLARYLYEARARGMEIDPKQLAFWQTEAGVTVSGRMILRAEDGRSVSDSPVHWHFELDEDGLVVRADGLRRSAPEI